MSGAHDRNRTGDLVLTKDVLYRLSYVGRLFKLKTRSPAIRLERVMGIEPTYSAWKAEVLPLNYTRKRSPVPVRPVQFAQSGRKYPRLSATLWYWWRGKDSNLRRHKPADLQSAPVGRLGTPPRTESRVFSGDRAAVSIQNHRPSRWST